MTQLDLYSAERTQTKSDTPDRRRPDHASSRSSTAPIPFGEKDLAARPTAPGIAPRWRPEWGRDHLRRVALSTATLCSPAPSATTSGRGSAPAIVSVLGIGAVFTPVDQRGRGHARALIELMMRRCGRARVPATRCCFPRSAPRTTSRWAFASMPRTLVVDRRRCPARGRRARDVRAIGRAPPICRGSRRSPRAIATARRSRSIDRRSRSRSASRDGACSPASARPACVTSSSSSPRKGIGRRPTCSSRADRAGVVLEECGDRDPTGARIGAILQVLAARTPADPALRLTAWLPRDAAAAADSRRPRIAVAGHHDDPRRCGDVAIRRCTVTSIYWQTDVF